MPGLLDLFGNNQPQPGADSGGGFSNVSNSLIGLGMGLLTPYNAWKGESPYANALQGWQTGSVMDQRRQQQAQQMAMEKQRLALSQQQLARQNEAMNLTDDIKEYNFAKQNGYIGAFQDWMQRKSQLQNRSANTPTYYYEPDAEGKPQLKIGQLNSAGGMTPVQLPPNAVLADPQQYLNTGGGFQGVSKRAPAGAMPGAVPGVPASVPTDLTSPAPMSGDPAPPASGAAPAAGAFIPIDKRTPARDTALGTVEGKAIGNLPAIEANTARTIARLDELEKHPGLDAATGFIMGKVPFAVTPAARDATARIQEIQSEAWTQAIQDMRGLGALSNAEGSRIESARSRLAARDVTTADYRKAISDLKEVMKTGLRNARLIASGKMKPYTDQDTAATPSVAAPTGGSSPVRVFNPQTGGFD